MSRGGGRAGGLDSLDVRQTALFPWRLSQHTHTPVASVAASFDTLDDVADDDESGGIGAAGIVDLCMPSTTIDAASLSANPIEAVPPQAHGVPSTIVGAASSPVNFAHPLPQKAKALPVDNQYT